MTDTTPYKICTLDPNAPCEKCELNGKLHCKRGEKSNTVNFYTALGLLISSSMFALGVAIYFTGLWWTIPLYVVYWGVYQLYVELIIHCPHCPYWDENSDEIICLPNCGIKKPTWKWIQKYLKHNPNPYSATEKLTLNLFNLFSMVFPLSVLVFSAVTNFHWMVIPAGTLFLLSVGYFTFFLKTRFCSACANFSCPLNDVSEEVANAFLAKNPYLGEAWKCKGYKIGPTK